MTRLCANGWPALSADSGLLWTWTIDGPKGDTRLRMRNGSVGFCLAHLALGFDRRIEQLPEPILDDWSYAFRAIRGFDPDGVLSNHAGYAIDLNATDHPLGVPTRSTFTADDVRRIHNLLDLYDGVIEWGGDWTSRPDAMHYEIAPGTTMAQVERVARGLLDSPRGRWLLDDNRGQRKVILS